MRKELDDNSQRGFLGRSPLQQPAVPRTCVLARVGDERAGHGEGFAAAVTHVGLLPCVPPHVVRQRAGLGKALPAAVTHVWLLPTVLPATTTAQPRQQHPGRRDGLGEGSVPCCFCCCALE